MPKSSRHSLPPAGKLPGTLERSSKQAQETFIRTLASAAQVYQEGDQALRAAYAEFKRRSRNAATTGSRSRPLRPLASARNWLGHPPPDNFGMRTR